ncbi:hypothetical protein [Natronosalvus amylolyticus]|uniref:hypothetical protein n=1 Tax=Natronosalvus amylolyticus TaxID=2961994 RepID=UPI0020CA1B87|nr:hypothetical protein [Natronosalvus amylolyticus]
MSQRTQALGRVWSLLWQFTVGYVLALIIGIIAMIWAILDLLWQLISGRNDFSEDSLPAQWVSRTISWNATQTIYGLTGGADRKWRPLP